MFENIKYQIYCAVMDDYLDCLQKAEKITDRENISFYSKKILKVGKKIIPLEKKLEIPSEGSVKNMLNIVKQGYLCMNN